VHWSLVWYRGETIQGNIEIDGNGYGNRVGRIAFTTNLGNAFTVGNQNTPYYITTCNGGFISGIFGNCGADLDALSFLCTKPVTSAQFFTVNYYSLSQIPPPLALQTQLLSVILTQLQVHYLLNCHIHYQLKSVGLTVLLFNWVLK